MKRKLRNALSLFLAVCMIFPLAGCWDSLDIEKRELIISLILDKKDDDYYYYTEVANLSGKSEEGEDKKSQVGLVISKGKTFVEARSDYDRKIVNEPFLGAERVLVFTERMSEEGIEEYLNRLRGQPDYRKSVPLCTTSEEPMDILKNKPENAASVGFAIESNLNSTIAVGMLFRMNVGDVLRKLAIKKSGFVLPDISLEEDRISISGVTVFDPEGKRIGRIPIEDCKGIITFLNPKMKLFSQIKEDDTEFTLKVKEKRKKIKTEYSNNHVTLNCDFTFDAELSFADKHKPISEELKQRIQDDLAEKAKRQMVKTLKTSQKIYRCDYLNLRRYFSAQHPDEAQDWKELYPDADINVTVHMNVGESSIPIKD